MKRYFRVNAIAAAVAVGLSASAHAITVTSSNSGADSFSELILVAYDDSKVGTGEGVTYVRGLGVQMDAFLPNSPLVTNPSVTVNAGAATAFAGGTRTTPGALFTNAAVSGDSNWTTFTSQVSPANIRWGVVGRKAGTAGTTGQYPAAVYTGVASPTNTAQVGTLSAAFGTLMNLANSNGCGGASDSCVFGLDIGANLGAAISLNGVGEVGDVLPFILAFKNVSSGTPVAQQAAAPAFAPFCNDLNALDCKTWSINGSTGEVTYSLAALQQPEPPANIPVPAAGWLLLTGIAGLVGLSRRKRSAG